MTQKETTGLGLIDVICGGGGVQEYVATEDLTDNRIASYSQLYGHRIENNQKDIP